MKFNKSIERIGLVFLFLFPVFVKGQISQGGTPVQIMKLKSAIHADLVEMPVVGNFQLQAAYKSDTSQAVNKKLHFAHTFDVSLNLKNSGKWYTDGVVNVWQLRIKSAGAYSLNLIFGRYHLPEKARLFLIGNDGNDFLGAYTSFNNSNSGILAIEPLAGDELLVQYEEPVNVNFAGEIEITKVAHDFLGIFGDGIHRPLNKEAGACNVNVNCDLGNGTEDLKNATCRIIIEGSEICNGTLINNTGNNGIPYLLTAYHCIGNEKEANSAVFLFNYEAPSCATVDGDISNSLSGSGLKASLKILDFSLVQLHNKVPTSFRPYFAGWNRVNVAPSNTFCINHPQGDIKKIAIDKNQSNTVSYTSEYQQNGFWLISKWDNGVTEAGSSGAGLFDQNKHLVGSLTAGAARCDNPINDYFEKFALSFDMRKDSMNRQLKYWLDPFNSNVAVLDGYQPYSQAEQCQPYTNLKDKDTYEAIPIVVDNLKKGYFSGSNQVGYKEFAERYNFTRNAEILGVSLGIAKLKMSSPSVGFSLKVQVYQGDAIPDKLIHTEIFSSKSFYLGAMNFLKFKNAVKTTGPFFIAYNIEFLQPGDTLAVYMAKRTDDLTNSFFLKSGAGWVTYNSLSDKANGTSLVTELIACNIDSPVGLDSFREQSNQVRFYPNPLRSSANLRVLTTGRIDCVEDVEVFDLVGKKQVIKVEQINTNELMLNFTGKQPGYYLIHLGVEGRSIVGKVAYMPSSD